MGAKQVSSKSPPSKAMPVLTTDIAIIGAGVGGCIAAIALHQALGENCTITLIEKSDQAKTPQHETHQTPVKAGENLPPAAERILKKLGLYRRFISANQQGHMAQASMGMQSYWGNDQRQIVDNLSNPDGFGWQLNRSAFEKFLKECATEQGVKIHWSTTVCESIRHEEYWKCQLQTGEDRINLNAKFIIDASGRRASFARQQGAKRQALDRQVAYWATIANNTENQLSTIVTCPYGWWYSAALPNQQRVVALHTFSDLVPKNLRKNVYDFLMLARAIPQIAPLISTSVNYHGVTAANTCRMSQVAGSHWAAIGDAAVAFDPLSSQGMFNAMATAMQLSDLIKASDILNTESLPQRENQEKSIEHAYEKQIDSIWRHYLGHWQHYYQQEKRWLDQTYWRERNSFA